MFAKIRQMILLVVSLQHVVLVSVLHFRIVMYCSNWIVMTGSYLKILLFVMI